MLKRTVPWIVLACFIFSVILYSESIKSFNAPKIIKYEVKVGEKRMENSRETSNEGKININTATASELTALPRIGDIIAERIIKKRNELGKFNNVSDLMQVKGIGDSTLIKLRDLVYVD